MRPLLLSGYGSSLYDSGHVFEVSNPASGYLRVTGPGTGITVRFR
jgi:hypothetical protein